MFLLIFIPLSLLCSICKTTTAASEVTRPDLTETPEVTRPDLTETPEVTRPDLTETPEVTRPDLTETPEVTRPDLTETPEVTRPDLTETPEVNGTTVVIPTTAAPTTTEVNGTTGGTDGKNGKLQRNQEIGEEKTWGPLFRISFDLVIHSKPPENETFAYYSILAFKGNGGQSDCCTAGDRVPAILYSPLSSSHPEHLSFTSAIGDNGNQYQNYDVTLEINKTYNFVIEQLSVNDEVVLSASVDGKKVYEVQNNNPSSFSDVKVFAGDSYHDAVDASYSNLKWENLPDSTQNF